MRARLLGVLLAVAVAAAAPTPVTAGAAPAGALHRPVPGAVLAGFDAPTTYGPGHRGVDLAAPRGSPVRAAAAGHVTFAGRVVDATWVTVDHGEVRTTVGSLRTVAVVRGQAVDRGEVLGTSGRAHGRSAVHWSARRGDTYVDPLRVRLDVPARVATLLPSGSPDRWRWPRRQVR